MYFIESPSLLRRPPRRPHEQVEADVRSSTSCRRSLSFPGGVYVVEGSEGTSDRTGGSTMTARETVALYYDAWQNRQGDFSDVPLADDFEFTGPVASFDRADGYRAMAREAGQAVTSFEVRRQFVDGNTVCSIIDWEMAMPGLGRMT